jgi:hypothetical protein
MGLSFYDSDPGEHVPLTPTSTARDYRAAAKSIRSQWMHDMCANGACLDPVDWKCGYSFTKTDPEEFKTEQGRASFYHDIARRDGCFMWLAERAPETDTLDKLRVLCGRREMFFIGERSGYKPEDCVKAGGEWGRKRHVFSDEETYFAGLR